MTEAHHDHPVITIALSTGLGLVSWLADPNVWRALAVAAACGFVGGVAKAIGAWTWNEARKRKESRRMKGRKEQAQ